MKQAGLRMACGSESLAIGVLMPGLKWGWRGAVTELPLIVAKQKLSTLASSDDFAGFYEKSPDFKILKANYLTKYLKQVKNILGQCRSDRSTDHIRFPH